MTAAARPPAPSRRERLGAFLRKYLIVFILLGIVALLVGFSPTARSSSPRT